MSKRTPFSYLSQSDISIRIERFVRAVESSSSPAYEAIRTPSGQEQMQSTNLSRYFEHIPSMLDLFDDRYSYSYSEQLRVFRQACQDIGLDRTLVCPAIQGTGYLSYHQSMNALVDRIRELTRAPWYRHRKNHRTYQAKQQQIDLAEYVNWVLNRCARTVVVRVDLHYRGVVQGRLRVEQVFDDLEALTRARERNPIFQYETGYICAVEQGEERGFHIHAAFFFTGEHVWSDRYKAQQIGELWEQITRGQGYYHSCNEDKDSYGDACGVGVVRRRDAQMRSNVIEAMCYLAKDDQHLRVRPARARCFRVGRRQKVFRSVR